MVKIGLLQTRCSGDPQVNLKKALGLAEQAAKQGAHIICTQELFRSQYFCQLQSPAIFDLAARSLRAINPGSPPCSREQPSPPPPCSLRIQSSRAFVGCRVQSGARFGLLASQRGWHRSSEGLPEQAVGARSRPPASLWYTTPSTSSPARARTHSATSSASRGSSVGMLKNACGAARCAAERVGVAPQPSRHPRHRVE